MKLDIPFNYQGETVTFSPGCAPDYIGRTAGGEVNQAALVAEAVAVPLGLPPLADFLRKVSDMLVVVNDGTRATPSGLILETIYETMQSVPRLKILVATGLHRTPTEEEYRGILGPTYDRLREVTSAHDGNTVENLTPVRSGPLEILVNPALAEAEYILVINSVEPHFFAGYTGGRKSFLPGLAGYPTVEASHAGAVLEAAAPLRTAGNPVREFIDQNTGFLDPSRVFAIQVVLDRFDKIVAAAAGNIDEAFAAACAGAYNFYTMPVGRRYDIVLAVVKPPLDINLYQTEKAWEHARYALKQGGILICVSACRQGIGSEFYQRLGRKYPDHSQWLALADRPYEMGLHKLVRTARLWEQGELWLVSAIDDQTACTFRYEPKPTVQAALDEAFAVKGPDASALIIDDAALTIPIVTEEQDISHNRLEEL